VRASLAAEGTDYEAMICMYADSRVDPHGVVTVNERWDEIKLRYATHPRHPLRNVEEVERRRAGCLAVENIIQKNVSIDLQTIDNATVAPLLDPLRSTVIR
jgi:hypothetical protein